MGRVEGKVAVVTGAGTGIGRAAAKRLAEEGAIITVAEMDEETGQEVAAEIGGQAIFVQHDVREEANWQGLFDTVAQNHGRPDILVNNAGILATENDQELALTNLEQWRAVQQVNVEGVFLGCKYGVAAMTVDGGRAKGRARARSALPRRGGDGGEGVHRSGA